MDFTKRKKSEKGEFLLPFSVARNYRSFMYTCISMCGRGELKQVGIRHNQEIRVGRSPVSILPYTLFFRVAHFRSIKFLHPQL